jgi:predicted ATPase
MFSLTTVTVTNILCGKYTTATALAEELVALAEEKSTALFNAWGIIHGGCVSALNGEAAEAIRIIPSGLSASRSTGARYLVPLFLSNLAMAYAELCRYDEASRCIDEVIITLETTKERWFEAEASRVAGEITLRLPMADAAKAQAYFERALAPMLTLSKLPASAGPYFFETFVDREGARLAPCSLISSVRTHNS